MRRFNVKWIFQSSFLVSVEFAWALYECIYACVYLWVYVYIPTYFWILPEFKLLILQYLSEIELQDLSAMSFRVTFTFAATLPK